MVRFPWSRAERADASGEAQSVRSRASFAVDRSSIDPALFGLTSWDVGSCSVPAISRKDALSVPAVLRSRNLIAGTIGGLPLHAHDSSRAVVENSLLDQPERGIPRSVSMTMLAEDLLFDGEAWWLVTERAWTGFPTWVRRLDPTTVNVESTGRITVEGKTVDPKDLIHFPGFLPGGLRRHAARAIRTALKLDSTAAMYANEPLALTYFQGEEDDLAQEIVDETLDGWHLARQHHATGYVPKGIALKQLMPMTPEQLQLAESRQHAVLEISRATGIDPEELGVSTTSRTYANDEQRRQAFIDFVLDPFIKVIEQRLSMGDVTPRGTYVRFDYAGLLRTDAKTRYESYELGLQVGAVVQDEIRALEDKPDLTTAQKNAIKPRPASVIPDNGGNNA